jgi:methionyl-tRNA formyltransferase
MEYPVEPHRHLVSTGDGTLEILELQPAGKGTMSAAEFLRGNRIRSGERFGPA